MRGDELAIETATATGALACAGDGADDGRFSTGSAVVDAPHDDETDAGGTYSAAGPGADTGRGSDGPTGGATPSEMWQLVERRDVIEGRAKVLVEELARIRAELAEQADAARGPGGRRTVECRLAGGGVTESFAAAELCRAIAGGHVWWPT